MEMRVRYNEEMKKEGGFGFSEFALILSFVGVLLSLALPAYLSYRIQQYNSTARNDVFNLGLSVLNTSDKDNLADCANDQCEQAYSGFEKSSCSKISTTAVSGDAKSPVVIGCCEGGSKGYMFSAVSGVTVEFPLSTGNCEAAAGGIEG